MKGLSVSHFKAKLAAHLREVQAGETLIITEHKRPVAEVRPDEGTQGIVKPASRPFSLSTSVPSKSLTTEWQDLLDEERGDR